VKTYSAEDREIGQSYIDVLEIVNVWPKIIWKLGTMSEQNILNYLQMSQKKDEKLINKL
jgi:hypothetical protein